MNKLVLGVSISVVIIGFVLVIGISSTQNEIETKKQIYHITLADPKQYENGLFVDQFKINSGKYEFKFVPNGDSPKNLHINLNGNEFSFFENFELKGTPHDTGISTYYTWEYLGVKKFEVPLNQNLTIQINPNEEYFGPVSVDIIQTE